MDYLRTAVSSVLSKSGLNLPFSLGEKVSCGSICYLKLYDATKRDDSSPVSVFEYNLNGDRDGSFLAKNALKKLRTMRHPDVLKFMEVVETESTIYIMTERVRPLRATLDAWGSKGKKEREDYLIWGLHRIAVALAFLNDSGSSTHGNIQVDSIFISPSGEWKLGGFEILSNPSDETAVLYELMSLLPNSPTLQWTAPEIKKASNWRALKENPVAAADSYALGLLLHTVFNPTHPRPATADPPHPAPTAASRGDIPVSIFPSFKRLVFPTPKARMTAKEFLDTGMAESSAGFFANNRLLQVCNGLDNFVLASEAEKTMLLKSLKDSAASFPTEFVSFRILPALVEALDRGGASAATILPLVLQFGVNLDPAQYTDVILAPLVKLFASPDRGTRMALLDHLPEYIDRLDKKIVSDKIFPNLQTGFTDTVAVIREATIKSISLLAPKLTDRLLNNDLLRHLAKMQQDPEASIRTNTCILMGRLGPTLGYHTKRKVLVPAFSRAAKDPFVHCRVAGLMAFMATIECFEVEELAGKVLPGVCTSLVDKEKLVRDQGFKAVELFVKKLESNASSMPDTALSPDMAANTSQTATTTQGGALVGSAAGAAGALAGWAISSLGKKLGQEDMITSMSGASNSSPVVLNPERSNSTPPSANSRIGVLRPGALAVQQSLSAAPSTVTSPSVSAMNMGASKAKGLQLGAHKGSTSMAAADSVLAEDFGGGDEDDDDNPWGEDLMDVNADADDWSAFESAPEPKPVLAPKPAKAGLGFGTANGARASFVSSTIEKKQSTVTTKPPRAKVTVTAPETIDWVADDAWGDEGGGSNDVTKSPPSRSGTPSAPLSKEDKALEMQRRKEERKLRIAALKEQKKASTPKS